MVEYGITLCTSEVINLATGTRYQDYVLTGQPGVNELATLYQIVVNCQATLSDHDGPSVTKTGSMSVTWVGPRDGDWSNADWQSIEAAHRRGAVGRQVVHDADHGCVISVQNLTPAFSGGDTISIIPSHSQDRLEMQMIVDGSSGSAEAVGDNNAANVNWELGAVGGNASGSISMVFPDWLDWTHDNQSGALGSFELQLEALMVDIRAEGAVSGILAVLLGLT